MRLILSGSWWGRLSRRLWAWCAPEQFAYRGRRGHAGLSGVKFQKNRGS